MRAGSSRLKTVLMGCARCVGRAGERESGARTAGKRKGEVDEKGWDNGWEKEREKRDGSCVQGARQLGEGRMNIRHL